MKNRSPELIISIINDEISPDIDICIQYLKKWDINHLELRSLKGINTLDLEEKILQKLKRKLDDNNISVSFISTPLFKWYPDKQNSTEKVNRYDLHFFDPNLSHTQKIEYIDKAISVIKLFNVNKIRVFTLIKDDEVGLSFYSFEKEVYDYLFEQTSKNNIQVVVENEPTCNLCRKADLKDIERYFNFNKVNLLLDFGNVYAMDEELTEYDVQELLKKSSYIHIKDYVRTTKRNVEVGKGAIDYPTIVENLKNSNKDFCLSLEPHLAGNIKAVEKSVIYLQNLIK